SSAKSGAPVRTARATASDGRADTACTWSPARRTISAKKVDSRSSVTTTRSTWAPSSSSRSFMRSWVIGRGVSTCSSAKAMAVASGPPMKIGRMRPAPSASRSTRHGMFGGRSSSMPTSSISIATLARYRTRPAIAPRDPSAGAVGVAPQRRPQERAAELLAEVGHLPQVLGRLLAGGGVALLEQRHDHLLHEAGLPLGRHLVHAQVTSLDAEAHEPGGGPGDDEGLAVEVRVAAHLLAHEEAVAGQLVEGGGLEAAGLGQLLLRERHAARTGVEPVVGGGGGQARQRRGRAARPAHLRCRGRRT